MTKILFNRRSTSHFEFEGKRNTLTSKSSAFRGPKKLPLFLDSKCSQGHIEAILSFVIFMGFTSVLFFFLNPLKAAEISTTMLDMTQDRLLKNWTAEYKIVSLTVDEGIVNQACFSVANPFSKFENPIVKDQGGELQNARIGPNRIAIESNPENRYFLLYFSAGFKPEPFTENCQTIEDNNASFGASTTYDAVLYESINATIQAYNANYGGLRRSLGLQNDFMFAVYDREGANLLNVTKFVPKNVEVVARNIPITAINQTAGIRHLILNLRAW